VFGNYLSKCKKTGLLYQDRQKPELIKKTAAL